MIVSLLAFYQNVFEEYLKSRCGEASNFMVYKEHEVVNEVTGIAYASSTVEFTFAQKDYRTHARPTNCRPDCP